MSPCFEGKKPDKPQNPVFWAPEHGGAAPPFKCIAMGLRHLGCRIFVWPFEGPVLRDKTVNNIL
jgi:hypothetical protein